jgi:Polyketide cyclase / dehydrase and lipid transport
MTRVRAQAEIMIACSPAEVFEYLANAETLPECVRDFASVKPTSDEEPAWGKEYSCRLRGGAATGTISWTEYEPGARLRWEGPPIGTRLGSLAPAGSWTLSGRPGCTYVTLVMAPARGGLLKLLAPLTYARMRRGALRGLGRLKETLEQQVRLAPV